MVNVGSHEGKVIDIEGLVKEGERAQALFVISLSCSDYDRYVLTISHERCNSQQRWSFCLTTIYLTPPYAAV